MPGQVTWPVCCYTVADVTGKSDESGGNALASAAGRVLENLAELEPELVAAGIFDAAREPVAVASGSSAWASEAAVLLDAVEAGSGDEKLDSAHIACEGGEAFVVSESGLSLVAVTGRFVLASLTSYDMRMALRDAVRSAGLNPASEAENGGNVDA